MYLVIQIKNVPFKKKSCKFSLKKKHIANIQKIHQNIEKYFCLLNYVKTAKTCMVSKKVEKFAFLTNCQILQLLSFSLKNTFWSGKVQDSRIVQLTISQLKDLKYAVTLSIISFSMSFFLQAFLPVAVMKTQLYFDLQLRFAQSKSGKLGIRITQPSYILCGNNKLMYFNQTTTAYWLKGLSFLIS